MNRLFPNSPNRVLQGKLLVATERLMGTHFEKTVVLLLQDDSHSGTFGVILNRPANDQAKQNWREMSGSPEHVITQLVHGGPMGGPVFAIHRDESLGEVEIAGDVFISAKAESIQQLFDQNPDDYRIFLGIAGWRPDQLESEIEQGLWYVMDSDPDDIFDDSTWLWEKSMFRFGEYALCDVVGIPVNKLPLDPSLN